MPTPLHCACGTRCGSAGRSRRRPRRRCPMTSGSGLAGTRGLTAWQAGSHDWDVNVAELFAVFACVIPVLAMALVCVIALWLGHRTTQRVASHAWRMMQANLALSKQPFAANLALKQEDTAQEEAKAAATNGHAAPMSPEM